MYLFLHIIMFFFVMPLQTISLENWSLNIVWFIGMDDWIGSVEESNDVSISREDDGIEQRKESNVELQQNAALEDRCNIQY